MKDKEFLLLLGERIRGFRNARALSQAELDDRAAIHAVSLSAVERGIANTSIITLCSIANALEIALPELFSFLVSCGEQPFQEEAEFAEILLKYRTLEKREKTILLKTLKALLAALKEGKE